MTVVLNGPFNMTMDPEPSDAKLSALASSVECYNAGTKIDRIYAATAIDDYCRVFVGQRFPAGGGHAIRYRFGNQVGQSFLVDGMNNSMAYILDSSSRG
jgi:hypothetical protein